MQAESPDHRDESATLLWQDARGQQWSLRADEEALTLSAGQGQWSIPQHEWDQRIDYDHVGQAMVFHMDLDQRQIGFMVTGEQGQALLSRMNWSNARALASAQRLMDLSQRRATWLTVTRWPLLGLFAAALSFIPLLGFAFAALAILCVVLAMRQRGADQRLAHHAALAWATLVIMVLGLGAQFLGLVTILNRASLTTQLRVMHGDGEVCLATKIIAVVMVLLSLSIHEAAHAVAAWWCGDEGPRQRGRVTLNPIPHIDPIGTILVPAILASVGGMIFGWAKPVMVTLHGLPNPRRANLLISAAGPLSNLLLGLLFLTCCVMLGCCIRLLAPAGQVMNYAAFPADVYMQGFAGAKYLAITATCLKWGYLINMFLFFFNFIPLPPLDGGHILASLFPRTVGELYRKLGPFAWIIFLMLIYTRTIAFLLVPGMLVIGLGLWMVESVTQL